MARNTNPDYKPSHNTYFKPIIASREEMTEKLEEYFQTTHKSEWTISGVCLAVGMCKDSFLYRYGKDPRYKDLVALARTLVASSYEDVLRSPAVKHAGSIFALKNLGWNDAQLVRHDVEGGGAVKIEVVSFADAKTEPND